MCIRDRPIWGEFMQNIYSDRKFEHYYTHTFEKPNKQISINLDCNTENTDNNNIFDESFD